MLTFLLSDPLIEYCQVSKKKVGLRSGWYNYIVFKGKVGGTETVARISQEGMYEFYCERMWWSSRYFCAFPSIHIVNENLKFGYEMAHVLLKIPSMASCAHDPS